MCINVRNFVKKTKPGAGLYIYVGKYILLYRVNEIAYKIFIVKIEKKFLGSYKSV